MKNNNGLRELTLNEINAVSGGAQFSATASFIDDGSAPSLKTFGVASIDIYTGNGTLQTIKQIIPQTVEVKVQSTSQFTPEPLP